VAFYWHSKIALIILYYIILLFSKTDKTELEGIRIVDYIKCLNRVSVENKKNIFKGRENSKGTGL